MKRQALALMSLALMASSVTPVFAAESTATGTVDRTGEYSKDDIEATTADTSCEVRITVGSTYSVTIPKLITLDSAAKMAEYTVSCKADIPGSATITVVPEPIATADKKGQFAMKQTGKADINAQIVQDDTIFVSPLYSAEITTGQARADVPENASFAIADAYANENRIIKGAVYADGKKNTTALTAGAWSGTFNFNVTFNQIDAPTLTLSVTEKVTTAGDVTVTYGLDDTLTIDGTEVSGTAGTDANTYTITLSAGDNGSKIIRSTNKAGEMVEKTLEYDIPASN
jgi:hypothetical protein